MVRAALLLLLSLFAPRDQQAPPPQWVVVTAPAYQQTVQPLCEHRASQGMRVVVIETAEHLTPEEIRKGDAAKLQRKVNDLCRNYKGKSYVLLLGAIGAVEDGERTVVPPLMGRAGRMRGQPSDNGYGCLGDSLLPEVAVGRLPARNVAEARAMVARTIAYENDTKPGTWRRRLTLLAGAPAFNPAADALVERLALARLGRLDPSWTGVAIYDNPSSRFSLPAGELNRRARRYVEEGQAITLYLGHSGAKGFGTRAPKFLDRDDWANLEIKKGPGIFATFGCFGCQLRGFDGEGYGLAAIRNPKGPVAVLGSHGECFAGMVDLALDGFLDGFFGKEPPERLGEAWLKMNASIAKKPLPLYFPILDAADGDPKIPAATQRNEHQEMFVLLGDPALRLPTIKRDLRVWVRSADPPDGREFIKEEDQKRPMLGNAIISNPGQEILIRGVVPARLKGGKVFVTVERPLTSMPDKQTRLPKEAGKRDAALLEQHERANTFILKAVETKVSGEGFAVRLRLPEDPRWAWGSIPQLRLRVYVATDREEGLDVQGLALTPRR